VIAPSKCFPEKTRSEMGALSFQCVMQTVPYISTRGRYDDA
jgi:hypothetical protein